MWHKNAYRTINRPEITLDRGAHEAVKRPTGGCETMGSLPRLKQKTEWHYRKGSTNESNNCVACKWFVKSPFGFSNGDRCILLGIKQSVRYRVRLDYTCDKQVMGYEYKQYLSYLREREGISVDCPGGPANSADELVQIIRWR
jgi:hypothetical protein